MPIPMLVEQSHPLPNTITTTLRVLFEAQPALNRLANEKLPVKLAYAVARMIRAVQPEAEEFMKHRNALVAKYGITRPATEAERPVHGPEVTEVLPEHIATFRREIEELANVQVRIDREPIRLTEENLISITAADLVALGPLVDVSDT